MAKKKKKTPDYILASQAQDKNYTVTSGGFKVRKELLKSIKSLKVKKDATVEMPLYGIDLYREMPRCCICRNPFTPRVGVTRNNLVCGRYHCISGYNELVRKHKDPEKLFKEINEGKKRMPRKGMTIKRNKIPITTPSV